MELSGSSSLASHPGEIILGVAAHLSVSDLNALIQTANRFRELLSQELYGRAPTLIRTDGNTPLIWATEQGRITSAQKLLERDPDPGRLIDGRAAIHQAAAEGQDQIITMLLEAGVSVSLPDSQERTPLDWAVAHDQTAIVRLLLAAGAGDVTSPRYGNWEWGCALQEAVLRGYESAARILLEAGASISQDHPAFHMIHEAINSQLFLAAWKGHCNLIPLLVEFGADAHLIRRDDRLPLHLAALSGHTEAIQVLLDYGADIVAVDETGDTAIHLAAAEGHQEVVQFLLDRGVPVDTRGEDERTVLLTAVIYRHDTVVKVLLDAGADLTLVEAEGTNALHLAACCATPEIMDLLLARGAAVDVLGSGDRTALHVASLFDNFTVIPALCRAGVALDAVDDLGNTALHLTALHGQIRSARTLLEMGADLSCSDVDGRTVVHSAAISGKSDVLQLLLDAGADVGAIHRRGGHTALHYAAANGWTDAFRTLLPAADAHGLDLLRPCWCGGTVLSKAATNGSRDILDLMVERGVNITGHYEGSSALHAAAAAGQADLVEFLLSLGADPLRLDLFGRSAIDWAARHPPTLEKLLAHAPTSSPPDIEGRQSALKEGIVLLATRALSEGQQASYRLGKCLIYIHDASAARMAFLYDARVNQSAPAVCDLCREQPTVTEGRFVCQTCPDIDLCSQCMEMYYEEGIEIPLCEGHEFLEIQASEEEFLAIQQHDARESWLRGLIAKYGG